MLRLQGGTPGRRRSQPGLRLKDAADVGSELEEVDSRLARRRGQ